MYLNTDTDLLLSMILQSERMDLEEGEVVSDNEDEGKDMVSENGISNCLLYYLPLSTRWVRLVFSGNVLSRLCCTLCKKRL